jgi:hypothetical protein
MTDRDTRVRAGGFYFNNPALRFTAFTILM